MKKTFQVDGELMREAKEACGAATDSEAYRLGLEGLIRHAAYRQMAEMRGSEPTARDAPRRREPPTKKRKVA